jgi:superoxide dismutase, Cu-Zn family
VRGYRWTAVAVAALMMSGVPTAGAATPAAVTLAWGSFRPYSPGAVAVTHEPALVPAGATASVLGVSGPTGTVVTVSVRGLLPHRDYGVHVHTRPCGRAPADSGPHFQHRPDPHQPSTDPAYANRHNEIWLDLSTDAAGHGTARASVNWTFAGRAARSVVIHEHHTHTAPGQAGTAGPRLACVNVHFH